MTDLDIRKLKKIDGDIVELRKVNKSEVKAYRDDCQNHVNHINQEIEILEYRRENYKKEVDIADALLRRN